MKMKQTQAVVITKPGEVGLQEVTLRPAGPDEVLVQTVYTSISAGTERMLLAGQMPHPMLALPVVPGYETVGRVVEVGSNVSPEWVERWVYVGGAQCYEGINAAWGGQSALISAPAQRVVPLEGVEPRYGVLLALAATALHGLDVLNPQPGERLLVLGQGPVGQLAARLARSRGVWVAAADRNPNRLAYSSADQIVNVETDILAEAIAQPVNAIIEATGSMEALAQALPLLAGGGAILLLGYYQALQLPYMPLFLKEARLLTAKEWAAGDLLRCRDMIAQGALDVSAMLTHSLPISEVAAAYNVALNDAACLKLVLNWKGLKDSL
ncbi:MAG: zinc-binding dehydrogenase [Anaerolineales bacterium]|nr:zinc-binding dehydrogenase [Anaerolineales bacterium]